VRLRSTTALLACVVLVAACGGNSKPQVLPTLPPPPTASATPLDLPASARPGTSRGLDAFVRYFFEQLNASFETQNPELIRRLSSPDCATCENYARSLGMDGNHILGDTFTNLEVAAPPVQSAGTIVEVVGSIAARQLADANGRVVKRLPSGGRFHFQVNVLRTGSAWSVRGIRQAV
jgi:hypothetical protein